MTIIVWGGLQRILTDGLSHWLNSALLWQRNSSITHNEIHRKKFNALSPASSFINKVLFTIATIHYDKTCTCTSFCTNILISCKIFKMWNKFEETRQVNKSILDFSLDLWMKYMYCTSTKFPKWETDLDNLEQHKISCFIGMEWGRFDYICMLTQLYPCKCNVIHFYTASIIYTFFTYQIWQHWPSSQNESQTIYPSWGVPDRTEGSSQWEPRPDKSCTWAPHPPHTERPRSHWPLCLSSHCSSAPYVFPSTVEKIAAYIYIVMRCCRFHNNSRKHVKIKDYYVNYPQNLSHNLYMSTPSQ